MKIFKINQIKDEYQGEHSPPSKHIGASLDNLSEIYPDDIYSQNAIRYYGHGFKSDNIAISIIQSAKNRPNYPVTVFRAVPNINKELDSEIKKLTDLLSYYNKFSFFPVNNPIVQEQREQINENMDYDDKEKQIYNNIQSQIDQLESTKQPKITINPGDWVSITREYAKEHGDSNLNRNYKILTKTVKAKDLYTHGDSIHEWGWNP